MKLECWKPIRQYDGYYEVSDCGNVRSVDRYVQRSDGVWQFRRGKRHRVFEDRDGYVHTKLCKDGTSMVYSVHRLVYEAFVGDIPEGYDVDHVDNNRENNHLSNLTVMSHTDNVKKSILLGRHVCTRGTYNGEGNPNYGNRALSERYHNDPALAREKQSRPGRANGRATPIRYTDSDGKCMEFGYIRQCARYMIDHCAARGNVETVAFHIRQALDSGTPYCGGTFSFI